MLLRHLMPCVHTRDLMVRYSGAWRRELRCREWIVLSMWGMRLTTHEIQSSVDFFSAQDQLLDREAGETGGAHIGSRELTTGVFYLPVVIDVEQVRKNFAGWTNKEIAKVVGWLVKTVATVHTSSNAREHCSVP